MRRKRTSISLLYTQLALAMLLATALPATALTIVEGSTQPLTINITFSNTYSDVDTIVLLFINMSLNSTTVANITSPQNIKVYYVDANNIRYNITDEVNVTALVEGDTLKINITGSNIGLQSSIKAVEVDTEITGINPGTATLQYYYYISLAAPAQIPKTEIGNGTLTITVTQQPAPQPPSPPGGGTATTAPATTAVVGGSVEPTIRPQAGHIAFIALLLTPALLLLLHRRR